MTLPEQLLLSDLLHLRVRDDQGVDHGAGVLGWMHPPVHRLLGWASRPSSFNARRLVWRLDQLRGIGELEAFVKGPPAEADQATLERLPTLLETTLTGAEGQPLGSIADAVVERRSGRILHYLVSRSDPRLPGSSRWRLTPDRIVDQQPGRVATALQHLDDLPLARASVRQEWLRRSRRWREQMGEETARLRDQFQQAGGRIEERLEGWLEEPPWQESGAAPRRWPDVRTDQRMGQRADERPEAGDPWPEEPWDAPEPAPPRRSPRPDRYRGSDEDDDPWI